MSKKTRIKIWVVLMITCVMCFSDFSFAQEVSKIWSISKTLDFLTSVLAWLWVVFANLAWKFLTNNWVYGQALKIDVLLWQYRNIVKNMANFCLWFYLVYVIFKWLIGQGKGNDVVKNLKNVLLWTLIAWIGIQASWFLTSVVIDVSTITLTAVGAFPSQVLSRSEDVNEWINFTMRDFGDSEGAGAEKTRGIIFDLFPKDGAANSFTRTTWIPLDKPISNTWLVDILMPNKDDVSGPLYYMWFSILSANKLNSISSESRQLSEKSILNLIIQWWTTIVYAIEMGVLCIIALMRIFYLWMFIVLSPLAVLLACIQKAWDKELLWKSFISDLMKQINLKTFVAKVFQPAIIVLWISLSMIFVTLISRIVNENGTKSMKDFDIWWAKITTIQDAQTSSSDDVTYTTKLEWNLLKVSLSTVWKWILDILMSIITVLLVYFIIDTSIKIWNSAWGWKDFLSTRIKSIQEWVTWVMTSLPIMPVAWYDKEWVSQTQYVSAGKVFGLKGEKSLIESKIDRHQKKVNEEYSRQSKIINSWFWNKTGYLSADEMQKIENAWASASGFKILTDKKDVIMNMRTEDWKWMTLNPDTASNNEFWIQEFTKSLERMKGQTVAWTKYATVWKDMIDRWNDSSKTDKTLEKLFKENKSQEAKSVEAYADLFGLSLSSNTWEQLKNADISQNWSS